MSAAGSPSAQAAETALFDDTLVCDVILPADFVAGAAPGGLAQAEATLRALAQVEDLRSEESAEERGELPALAAQRIEAKLDLVLALLGRLVAQSGQALSPLPLRWSRRGLRLLVNAVAPIAAVGARGLLRLQPSDWYPDRMELPVIVLAEAEAGPGMRQLWLRFEALPEGLEEAIDRHLFRLHRRQVAVNRRR